jgi:hypothetical protein
VKDIVNVGEGVMVMDDDTDMEMVGDRVAVNEHVTVLVGLDETVWEIVTVGDVVSVLV